MASEGFHESSQDLKPQTRDMHRAIVSLMEELEAIDWYQQRIDATLNILKSEGLMVCIGSQL